MGEDSRILRFTYKGCDVDVNVDVDRSNLLDVIIEFEDKSKENGFNLCVNPEFMYVWKMKNYPIEKDIDLMEMFDRLHGSKIINIWVGGKDHPSELNKLVMGLRKTQNPCDEPTNSVVEDGNGKKVEHFSRAKLPI